MEEKSVELKHVSEREIWVGENRFYLGENDILYETIVGQADDEMGMFMEEATDKLKKKAGRQVDVLIDVNRAGKPSPKTRARAKKTFEDEGIGKVAIFGVNPVGRVISSFVIGVTKKKDLRLFKSKEDALAWLKE